MPSPSPSPAPPSRGVLPPLAKPKPVLRAAKSVIQGHAQAQPRAGARAQPVAVSRSKRLDDALSAGFVRLLNAGHIQEEDSGGGTGELYDPKPGDFAVGVVVSGTEARLDVAVGADRLATLLAKELLPLDRAGADTAEQSAPPRPGSVGVVTGPAMSEEELRKQKRGSRALVAPGTVVFAEVLGRTLSGRPLLSARRLFRRLAWHRARQEMTFLKEGTLLRGTVRKIFSYGAQVRIAGTNRSGLLHISNISQGRVSAVSDILKIDDEVKVLVIKSNVPDKIALSIADLESQPGLFLSDRAKVFSEAEEMAQRYREQLPVIFQHTSSNDDLPGETLPFDDESALYANWKWFKFLQQSKPGDNSDGT
ncbi:hypothetical protein PR202_gb05661 [Eleusine coracana subsp. coracana]|uniref:S1 motif domain-containing protein n=1 Tax=Eleusine coracana subsp. coracana TaxID=191504 RepID=A0AAV5E515_ELECO|nr:hypothetical protein PR202_gb05661 [Eleusine coracana subsp. coracana]